jgi:hypothetical protein
MRVVAALCVLAGCSVNKELPPATAGDDAAIEIDADTTMPAPDARLCATPPMGLIAWWPGDSAAEIVGNRTSTLRNGASANTTGKVGGAFDFDGVDDRLDIVTDLAPLTQFTIEGWVSFASATSNISWRTVFGNDSTGPGLWMKDRRICWFQSNSDRFVSNVTIPTGSWHHFALVYGADQVLRGYVDGNTAGTASYAAAFIPAGATVGGYGGFELEGKVDELSIYDRALSASEIDAIVDAGAHGKCQ